MEQNENSRDHRLKTPERSGARRDDDGGRRSRSRLRSETQVAHRSRTRHRSRSPVHRSGHSRSIREKERELERDQDRVRHLEEEIVWERSRLRTRSRTRRHSRVVDTASSPQVEKRPSRPDDRPKPRRCCEQDGKVPALSSFSRTTSPVFSAKDVADILNSIKSTQPSAAAHGSNKLNYKNILPEFDPSSKNQRIDIWLRKVNECATVYGWDDKTIVHFAMQKLQGLAKTWYEGLNSILFSWTDWQAQLLTAFPCEQNFGQTLEEMLKRKSKIDEPIEVYFYEKIALLNRCDIVGKRAVDCVIHGLSDKTQKTSALALRCTQPDQLLQFLMSNKDIAQSVAPFDRTNFRNSFVHDAKFSNNNNADGKIANPSLYCYNCKEQGHPFMKCPKPLIKCQICQKFGHKSDSCKLKPENKNKNDENVNYTASEIDE